MKLKSYNLLFAILSYLSDKTNGASFFVKYKLMLGTIILGVVASDARASKKDSLSVSFPDKSKLQEITCYKPALPNRNLEKIAIKGIVLEEGTNEELIGATIYTKNNREQATIVGLDGGFSLMVNANDTLVFSFVGMVSQEIAVADIKNKEKLEVRMMPSNDIMCYVVVVGKTYEQTPKMLSCYTVMTVGGEKQDVTLPQINLPNVSDSMKYGTVKGKIQQRSNELQLKGVVFEKESDEPLIGVAIYIKGKGKRGTVSDSDGAFSLKVDADDVLVFSYIGFEEMEVPVSKMKNKEKIEVGMKDSAVILCYEVVVESKAPKISKLSYDEVEIPPVSPVGDDLYLFKDWMEENIRYTDSMRARDSRKSTNRLLLSFAIDKKGKIVDKKVLIKLSPEIDKEVLRVLSSSAKWTPGMHHGKPIKTLITLAVDIEE